MMYENLFHPGTILTWIQPVKVVLKGALSGWLLRELDPPSTSAVNNNEDSGGQGKDMIPDSDGRNGEPETGSDITVVEEPTKNTPTETSQPVESRCLALFSCCFRRSPASHS